MWSLIITLGILGLGSIACAEEKVFTVAGKDSYLEAYKITRGESADTLDDDDDASVQKTDRRQYLESGRYPYPNPQPQYGPPSGQGGLPNYNYGPARPQYGPPNPAPVYGPPNTGYGPPNLAPSYAAPAPVYGPPNPPPAYGPPVPPPAYGPPVPPPQPPPPVYGPPSSVQVFYGVPHAMLTFWDKLKLKLDLFTIGKILLKLVIFKKIVSFIAILCLLLFIPALKHKVESQQNTDSGGGNDSFLAAADEEVDDMLMRNFGNMGMSNYDSRLNNLAAYVIEAIESFSKKETGGRSSCNSTYCQTQNVLKKLNKVLTYKRLAKLYSKEL